MRPRPTTLRIALVTLSAAALAVGTAACEGPGLPIDTSGGGPDGPPDYTFTIGVSNALKAETCGTELCHDPIGPGGNLILPGALAAELTPAQLHAEIISGGDEGTAVVPGSNASLSLLLTKGSGTSTLPHTGGQLWQDGDSNYEIVEAWITSGALLN